MCGKLLRCLWEEWSSSSEAIAPTQSSFTEVCAHCRQQSAFIQQPVWLLWTSWLFLVNGKSVFWFVFLYVKIRMCNLWSSILLHEFESLKFGDIQCIWRTWWPLRASPDCWTGSGQKARARIEGPDFSNCRNILYITILLVWALNKR